jgi:uncharacterized membrane-anchored protein
MPPTPSRRLAAHRPAAHPLAANGLALFVAFAACCAAPLPLLADDAPAPTYDWQAGPTQGDLGDVAAVAVPDGFLFLDAAETDRILRSMGNLAHGDERGSLFPKSDAEQWFVIFQWDPSGFVKDTDKDELDADELLTAMKKGNEQANEERAKNGLPALTLVGWEVPPHYDEATHNLEWGLRLNGSEGQTVNYNIRILGREGVMEATWVGDPSEFGPALPVARKLLAGYDFKAGHRYAEFKKGDKLAEYGLKGLVLGGAAAAAVKFGLFKKFWKLLVFGAIALASFFKKLFGRLFGSRAVDMTQPPSTPPPPPAG